VTAPEPMGLVETPRTDVAEKLAINDVCDDHIVAYHLMREFAADLERETIAQSAEIERLKAALAEKERECERWLDNHTSLCVAFVRAGVPAFGTTEEALAKLIAKHKAALQSHSSDASSVSREAVQSTAAAAHADNTSGGKRCE
jgi:translation elongation factor EF-Ts